MNEPEVPPTPKPAPLFTLNLSENGGTFQPVSINEAISWIQHEQTFWVWLSRHFNQSYGQGLRQGIEQLNEALNHGQRANQYKDSNPQQHTSEIEQMRSRLEEIYSQGKFPHSSTSLAKRIEAYRQVAGDQAAGYFTAVFVPPAHGHHFQPQDLSAWRGLVEGLIDRYNLYAAVGKGRKQAAEQSFEQLRAKAEQLVSETTEISEALHRDYSTSAEVIRTAAVEQAAQFNEAQGVRQEEFANLKEKLTQDMEALRKTFREEIALRAPAEYWEKKRVGHRNLAWVTGILSFAGIGIAARVLGLQIHDLLKGTPPNTAPDSWRVAVLVLIGIFLVWGVRLVVRMFLSHLHLLTDASERVVMVQTYLSLLEGDRLASKEDRQLILQALFRPASDGIVKDEGLPISLAEVLTRTPRT